MYVTRHSVFNTPHLDTAHVLHDGVRQAFDRLLAVKDREAFAATESSWSPRVDIREDAQRFVILADIPGIDPALVEVSMDKGVLSIVGERNTTPVSGAEADHGGQFTHVERGRGKFNRRFTLPESADAEGITASGHHGVLEIVIPKKALPTPRRITINSGH